MPKKRSKSDSGSSRPSKAPPRAEIAAPAPDEPAPANSPGPGLFLAGWCNLRQFSGFGDATLLWPRWLVLRAVGIVFVFVFAGIVVEGRALVGPLGVSPLATYFSQLRQLEPGFLAAFCKAPSLFWLSSSAAMVMALAWTGVLAAIALVLNWWPRLSLFLCWLVFLSFVTTWGEFSPAQLDRLMLEVAVLCIPFAPRGLRPGLGADSSPRPIAVFMMRWMLFRVMVESGVVKLLSADPHWRNLTAMDVMYETSPSPTVLGFWVHQLPHGYHVFEIAFTFAAELLAPALAVFGGRRGRWIALVLWTLLQVGIELTCNFGWLNLAALGLGLLLLDDRMIGAAVEKLRQPWLARIFSAPPLAAAPVVPGWKKRGLRLALEGHFLLTLYYFAKACGVPVDAAPAIVRRPVEFFAEFRSANGYYLYANFDAVHWQVDFEGSNDAGKTWRTYEYRHVPQSVDRALPFTAPRFARFETTLQIQSSKMPPSSVFSLVAAHLLVRSPNVAKLFRADPFPDRPPTVVRMRRYRMTFVDSETHRKTGAYWRKEFADDSVPAMYLPEQGGLATFNFEEADAALNRGQVTRALALFEAQYRLGNLDAGYRMADLYSRGEGIPAQPGTVFAIFTDLAGRGEVKALHNLALCYEHGIGVPADFSKAVELYRNAAERGNLASIYALGVLAAEDRLAPRNDIEGLAFLLRAARKAEGEEPLARFIREQEPAQAKRLMGRMREEDVAQARRLAARR